MVVIDAKEMKEIARAEMEGVFPMGFHGVWDGGKV
jgi:torulene dioxygenase